MAKADNYQSPGTGKEGKITDPLMTNGDPAHVSQAILFTNKPTMFSFFP